MPRLVIVGGGVAGLAAAWAATDAARQRGLPLEVMVLERGGEVGGKARSIFSDGWLVEGGPSGFLDGRPEMARLIAGAGLTDDVVIARETAKRRFIYRGGRLREIVPSPFGFARSGILSPVGMMRMMVEPFVPRANGNAADETVWAFAARRLGAEVADRLVSPMALGIFAGDARRLSLAAAFPRMEALEREHGSLIRGLIARRGKTSTGQLTSFRGGMQSLPQALVARGGFAVRCHATVASLRRSDASWSVTLAETDETITADAVVLATEPWVTAELMEPVDAHAARALAAIPCPPIAVVALGFGPEARARVPDGFGVLIARGEGFRMLGNLWETSLYPGRGPEGGIMIRAMFGGAVDPTIGELSDDALLSTARAEIRRLYGLDLEPQFSAVVRVPRAIPQYEQGHRDRVAVVEQALAALPGLAITGFGLRGVAFADAASDGVRTGERVGAWLAMRSGIGAN